MQPVYDQTPVKQIQGLDSDPILRDLSSTITVFDTQPLALVDCFEYLSANAGHSATPNSYSSSHQVIHLSDQHNCDKVKNCCFAFLAAKLITRLYHRNYTNDADHSQQKSNKPIGKTIKFLFSCRFPVDKGGGEK
jgi:hypothetical protein